MKPLLCRHPPRPTLVLVFLLNTSLLYRRYGEKVLDLYFCLLVQGVPCLVPRHLSLVESFHAIEGGKEKTVETLLLLSYFSFPWFNALHHHQSLAFWTCLDAKDKAPEEEAGVLPLYQVCFLQVQYFM